jgi:hypothetical protein
LADEAGLGAGGSFAVEPDRRNARAGEDRELGGGSGISHANAAGERADGSADAGGNAGGTLDDRCPEGIVPDGPGPEGALDEASSSDGFAADSAGSVAVQAAGAVRAGGSKLNAGESSKGDGSLAWLSGVSRSGSGPFGRVLRDDPMLSAGSAGTSSARVASTAEARAASFGVATAGLPLAEASWPPFAEASLVSPIPFPLAGAPLTETPPPAVPSDAASSAGAVLAEADLAAVGVLADCLGGAMTSLDRVSWSSPIRSSSADLEVTTAGEAPPDPSDLSVRLSKPSSSDPDPHEVISGQDAHMTTYEKKAAFARLRHTHGTLSPPKPLPSN